MLHLPPLMYLGLYPVLGWWGMLYSMIEQIQTVVNMTNLNYFTTGVLLTESLELIHLANKRLSGGKRIRRPNLVDQDSIGVDLS